LVTEARIHRTRKGSFVYSPAVADLFAAVRKGNVEPVYILAGGDPLLQSRAVNEIRDVAVPEGVRGFNYDVIDGKGAKAAQLLAAAQTLPMMASRRMVLVNNLQAMPAAELSQLVDYLADPSPSTVFVGRCTKVDKRIRFFAQAKKRGFLHELTAPRRLGPWLKGELDALGIKMSSGAQKRLIDVIGGDLARLSLASTQLSLYVGDGTVEVEHVDDLVADTRERSVFELTDALGACDLERSLAAVGALCDQRQSGIGVVVMLARFVRQLQLCQEGLRQRKSQGELASMVGVPPFVVSKLSDQAKRFSPKRLPTVLTRLADADRRLKGQGQLMRTLGRPLAERVILEELAREFVDAAR
jgi:DNA polymerase-3 subunit delta